MVLGVGLGIFFLIPHYGTGYFRESGQSLRRNLSGFSDRIELGSMIDRLCLFARWLATERCVIRDIHADLVPLVPNRAQRVLFAAMMEQASQGLPVRIVILKARKPGVSTFIQALYFFMCATVLLIEGTNIGRSNFGNGFNSYLPLIWRITSSNSCVSVWFS